MSDGSGIDIDLAYEELERPGNRLGGITGVLTPRARHEREGQCLYYKQYEHEGDGVSCATPSTAVAPVSGVMKENRAHDESTQLMAATG